jgi:exopolysaccharide biosynthesis polyprenyl glycosylphosphotransferase
LDQSAVNFHSPVKLKANSQFRDLPKRYSQQVFCNLLAVFEAFLVALVAGAVLHPIVRAHVADTRLVTSCAIAVGLIALSCAAWSGAASYDGFASRKALLPGAMAAGAFAALVAAICDAPLAHILFCAAALFCAAYIAKIPSLLFKQIAEGSGRLTRLVAVAADEPAHRDALVALLSTRDDIEIVFSGSPSNLDRLRALTQEGQLDEIVLAGHSVKEENVAALAGLAVTIARVAPNDQFESWTMAARSSKRPVSPWNAPAAIIAKPPLRDWGGVAKRALDIAGALIALTILSPIMLFCAFAVMAESSGPVFFIQERAGYRNKPFRMFKFRTMHVAASDHTGSQLTLRDDPRVTRVGKILRKTSADELPQLFNVLLGDMSLVGPRPHPQGAKAGSTLYDVLIPDFYSRYRMKPGITGLAQINGQRGNTETEQHLFERFRSDLRYAAEWSPLLDIVIMARTIRHLCKGTNAF